MTGRTSRIMTLGIIARRGPISGYGIERTLREWAVSRWTTIAPASVYNQLRTLAGRGLISPVDDSSSRATEYFCTAAGRVELRSLLLDLLADEDVRPMGLLPLLHFTPELDTHDLVDGLQRRIDILDAALERESEVLRLAAQSGPDHVVEVFRLTGHALRADRQWCAEFHARLTAPSRPRAT